MSHVYIYKKKSQGKTPQSGNPSVGVQAHDKSHDCMRSVGTVCQGPDICNKAFFQSNLSLRSLHPQSFLPPGTSVRNGQTGVLRVRLHGKFGGKSSNSVYCGLQFLLSQAPAAHTPKKDTTQPLHPP